jgi:hypothetical protein
MYYFAVNPVVKYSKNNSEKLDLTHISTGLLYECLEHQILTKVLAGTFENILSNGVSLNGHRGYSGSHLPVKTLPVQVC